METASRPMTGHEIVDRFAGRKWLLLITTDLGGQVELEDLLRSEQAAISLVVNRCHEIKVQRLMLSVYEEE